MNGTAWVEHLASKDEAHRERLLRKAALAVVAACDYRDGPELRDMLEAIGWLPYPATVWKRAHGSKARRGAA